MSDSSSPSHQAELESVLVEYLRAAEAGRPLDERALLEAHPNLAVLSVTTFCTFVREFSPF